MPPKPTKPAAAPPPKKTEPPAASTPPDTSQAVTVRSTGTAVGEAAVDRFSRTAERGLQNVTAKDIIIPRLGILQKLSPQIDIKKPEFIKGANVGDICDLATQTIIEKPLIFLPVSFVKLWLEWAPRSSGKGLVNIHHDESIIDQCLVDPNKPNLHLLPNGNKIVETSQFFGLNLSLGGRKSFIAFASTQIKKSRRWLTLATGEEVTRDDGTKFTPPLFYRSYSLTTVNESNNDGDWEGWKVERHAKIEEMDDFDRLFTICESFEASISKGESKADLSDVEAEEKAQGRAGQAGGADDGGRM